MQTLGAYHSSEFFHLRIYTKIEELAVHYVSDVILLVEENPTCQFEGRISH